MTAAFQNIRVLDLAAGQALITGNMLGKLGADVVAVEPPGGSRTRRHHGYNSRGGMLWASLATARRGITCDLLAERGRALFAKLAGKADMIITGGDLSGSPTPAIDWNALRLANPRLILVSITPFGEDGPKAGYAATDLILWAAGGALFPSRDRSGFPLRISSDQALLHAGADAAVGALAALAAREKTGRGQVVSVSAQQSVAQATLSTVLATEVGHENFSIVPEASKRQGAGKKAPDLSGSGSRTRRSKWSVRDGAVEMHLAMGAAAGRFTNNLFAWLASIDACQPRFAEWDWVRQVPADLEAGRLSEEDIDEARGEVAAALAGFLKAELIEIAIRNKLLLAPILTIADLAASPHLRERGAFAEIGEGEKTLRLPSAITGGPTEAGFRPAPRPGEHNQEIYGELGLDAEDLAALNENGVI